MTGPLSEYQERSGASLPLLVFAAGITVLFAPLYGWCLVVELLPRELLEGSPSLPLAVVPLALTPLCYLSRRLRGAGLLVRLLPVASALVAVPALWGRSVPLVSPVAAAPLHRAYLASRPGALAVPALHALAGAAALAFGAAALTRRASRSGVAAVAHGSARWASVRDVRAAGLLAPPGSGLHLGYFDPGHTRALTDASDHHVLVMAPPGVGKTTALVIPTLLSCEASAWVLDPKGELFETTAFWRAQGLGHRVIRYAPTDPDTPPWNPLLEIPLGSGDIATAADLARNLVVAPATEGNLHWILAARSLFTALALHVRYAPEVPATMAAVRSVLASHANHDDLFGDLAGHPHDQEGRFAWTDPLTGDATETHPEVALLARKFLATPPRERGSVISTLQQFLDPWGDPQIARATACSEVDLGSLLGGRPTTLYLTIPFHDLTRLAPLVRLQLAALGRRLTARPAESPARLEVIVDELASLGRLPIMEDLLAFLRGYGARAFLLLQDLAQVRRLYGDRESITGNCRVHLTTATQAPGTRRHASGLAGATTARYRRTTRSRSGRLAADGRRSTSMVEASRPLVTEGEVGTLPLDQAMLFKAGMPPVKVHLRPYFADPILAQRVRPPGALPGAAALPGGRT